MAVGELVEAKVKVDFKHLVVLSNSVGFCKKQYIVAIVLQALNRTIWEVSLDQEVELFKKFLVDKILEELKSRLGRDLELLDIKEALKFTFCWFKCCGGSVTNTPYLIYDRLQEDSKFKKDPFHKVLRIQNCTHPQIVIGKDSEGHVRVLLLGISAIETGDLWDLKHISFTVLAKEFLVLDNESVDWETASVEYLLKFFVKLLSVVVVSDKEPSNIRESRLNKVREKVDKTRADSSINRFHFLIQNVVDGVERISYVFDFCSLAKDLENDRITFLLNEAWERTDHHIFKELQRNNFPLSDLDDAIIKEKRFNFLTFDFTEHLKEGWPLRWNPEEVNLSCFLNSQFEDIFFYCRHPALVHWGPYLEGIVGDDVLERFDTSFKNTDLKPSFTVEDLFRSFKGDQSLVSQCESFDYNSIQLLLPSNDKLILRGSLDSLFRWGTPFPKNLVKASSRYSIRTASICAAGIQKVTGIYNFKVTSSIKKLLLKGRLAILEQRHLIRCASCRVLGVDLKRSTGALSIFCIGATELDSYPLATLRYDESKDFILFYSYVHKNSFYPFQYKILESFQEKLVRESNKADKKKLALVKEQELLFQEVLNENGGTRSSKRLKSGASSKGVPK